MTINVEYPETKQVVKNKFPDATSYCKNGYYYIKSEMFRGLTIGSGSTAKSAWKEAYECVMEERDE